MLTEQLTSLLDSAAVLDRRQLCIDPGKAAWAVYLDIYVLDAGGWVLVGGWVGGLGGWQQAGRQRLHDAGGAVCRPVLPPGMLV